MAREDFTNIIIHKDRLAQLKLLAEHHGRTVSDMLGQLITDELEEIGASTVPPSFKIEIDGEEVELSVAAEHFRKRMTLPSARELALALAGMAGPGRKVRGEKLEDFSLSRRGAGVTIAALKNNFEKSLPDQLARDLAEGLLKLSDPEPKN